MRLYLVSAGAGLALYVLLARAGARLVRGRVVALTAGGLEAVAAELREHAALTGGPAA